jgi:polyhydroxyalkanoate synthase subunit PhaC
VSNDLAPPYAAPQHERGPRPLPLFLQLVRLAGETDPALAAKALQGLRIYQCAERNAAQQSRSRIATIGGASLRDCGGSGPPVVLVPSLINPPHILDLDQKTSLAEALTSSGRVLLLDWGRAPDRSDLSVTGHVSERLVPLLEAVGEPATLIGYCLGGTMALAGAAAHVRGIVTLASPWHFSAYPQAARDSLARIWKDTQPAAEQLGVLPIEVLQAAFWALDPHRVVSKYARLAGLDPQGDEFRRFVVLEDWANGGEPLPLPAARELLEDLFARDLPGRGRWSNPPDCPLLHFTASADRIVPAGTAAEGEAIACPSGHVGMIVGRGARQHLHQPLRDWLARLP